MDEATTRKEPPIQKIIEKTRQKPKNVLDLDTKTEEEAASMADTANRNFSEYLGALGISKEDLGKDVLDLGSGREERFSRQASKLGIKVVSLNPKLAFDDLSKEIAHRNIEGLPPHQGKSVAALATHLPFKDNSFDSVVSVFAIPIYLPKELYGEAFSEITRILRSAGKAFLAPLDIKELDYIKSILDKNPNISYSINKGRIVDQGLHILTTIALTKK